MDGRREDALLGLESERQRLRLRHRMQVRLVATRLLEEALRKPALRRRETAFTAVRDFVAHERSEYGKLVRFRRVVLKKQAKVLRRACHQWH